ncbi:hypothetical protein Gpo141_00008659 [Globisporangium polare]
MHAKTATSPAPFKGESFPSYVLQRMTRTPGGPSVNTVSTTTPTKASPCHATSPSQASSPLSSQTTRTSPLSSSISVTPARARPLQLTLTSPHSSSPTRSVRSFQRPSLSDQLKSISQSAQDITAQLKTSYKLQNGTAAASKPTRTNTLALQATTIGMSVGKLECRFPCPVSFLHDHCTYLFQHPYEAKEIEMVMFYRDMTQVHVNLRDKSFQFRINHALGQFGDDYRPANPQHVIRIVLATASEAQRVKQFIAEQRHWFASSSVTS